MILTFNTRGNKKQTECAKAWIDPEVRDIVFGGGKGGAKSFTGVSLIFGDAFIYPGTHYFIARNALNDLRKFTIPSIREVLSDIWKLPDSSYQFNGMDNFYRLSNGSKIFLLEAKFMPRDPDYMRFGSMQMTRGWIEEAGEIEESAKNNLMASVGRWKNKDYNLSPKLLQTCNPSKNYLYREYYRPWKGGKLEKRKRFIQALATDNKMLTPEYIENLEQSLNQNQKERLLFGNWEFDDDPSALIEWKSIQDYFTNEHVKFNKDDDSTPEGRKYITCDVARLGQDQTVIRVWHGWVCVERSAYPRTTIPDTVALLNAKMTDHQIPRSRVVIDEDGVGGGVVDGLPGCVGFIANAKVLPMVGPPKNYANVKGQCTFMMAEKINKGLVYEPCHNDDIKSRITAEMEQVKQISTEDMSLRVAPKNKVKEMIGRSPDDWDSIVMRMYIQILYHKKP